MDTRWCERELVEKIGVLAKQANDLAGCSYLLDPGTILQHDILSGNLPSSAAASHLSAHRYEVALFFFLWNFHSS